MPAQSTDATPDPQPGLQPPSQPPSSGDSRVEADLSPLTTAPGSAPTLAVGDAVRISRPLSYLKTADPMPMLRPPDLVDSGEVGIVRERRPADALAVRFRRGTFLLSASDLRPAGGQAG